MYPYFFVLFSIIALQFSKVPYGKHIAFLMVFMLSALRFDVGFDYQTYFDVVAGYNEYEYERFGFIDKLIIDISRFINFYQFYFIVTSFAINYLIFKTIYKYSSNFYFGLLIFYVIPIFYLNSLTIIRQYVAVAFVFFSIKYVFNRNFLKFIAVISIAAIFHISAFVALPIYFLKTKRFSFSKIFLMLLIVVLSPSILRNELAAYVPYYSYYIQDEQGGGWAMMIFLLSIFVFISLNIDSIKNERTIICYNIYTIGLVFYCFFVQFGEVGPRISLYYLIFLSILLPEIIQKRIFRKMMPLFLFMFVMLFFTNFYFSAKDQRKDQYVPYENFLTTNPSSYNWK